MSVFVPDYFKIQSFFCFFDTLRKVLFFAFSLHSRSHTLQLSLQQNKIYLLHSIFSIFPLLFVTNISQSHNFLFSSSP